MSDPSQDKAAAMRAAFLADLRQRLSTIEGIAERMRCGLLSEGDARAALLAQMHDIKGCGAPYGVPEATVLARAHEQQLAEGQLNSADFAEHIIKMISEFRRVAK